MKATRLRTEHLNNPLGIDVKEPLLSWNCEGGERQSAYQITAFSEGKEIWTTGKVESGEMHAFYQGPVESRLSVEWRVTLWNEKGEEEACKSANFEFAFLEKSDFKAKWINPELTKLNPEEGRPASVLIKEFTLDRVNDARIYATAHGVYALYLNGKRINENVLTPGTSEYATRLPYQTFDVSGYLVAGNNRIEAVLGDGWYRGCNGNTGTRNVFGTDIVLWLQLEVDKKIVLVTDESWKAAQDGAIYFNDIQLGEKVDARREPHFHAVKVENFGYQNLICANTLPLKEKESFAAKLIKTPNGETVLDFGQNMAGYVSFALTAKAGQKLTLTFGEFLDENGNFSDANLQTIGRKNPLHQVVEYTCKDGLNEYTPTLCIFGFQMVKVETDIAITGEEFTAHAVYSDMEQTATFECDKPLVNKFFVNTIWSEKSNFVDIPTDCPQRERSGWTGDAGVFAETGLMLMDSYPVFARWLRECRELQYKDGRVANIAPRRQSKPNFFDKMYDGSTGWGDASVIVPYMMYRLTGDKRILEENYFFMRKWLCYCEKKAKKSRFKNRFKKNPYKKYTIDTGIHWGEWLEAGVSMQEAMKEIIFNGCPDVATAYFAYSSRLMCEIAELLGKKDDKEKFEKLAENARKAYNFLEVKNGRISSKRQCRYVRPLFMGLLGEKDAKQAAADLNELVKENGYHLNTGFLTTSNLCKVLADYGYTDTAYRLLLQEETPGWLYQVKQGATTVWESWEGNSGSTGVASLNHYSKGAVVCWLVKGICGINVTGREIIVKPQPNPLMKFAKAEFVSPVGEIKSGWEYQGDQVEYTISIPVNTTAKLLLPNGKIYKLSVGENKINEGVGL